MLIFEKSVKGRTGVLLDECDVPAVALNAPRRAQEARLPEVSEIDVIRHYTALSKKAHGVDDGFYPLGSCTMKYNPRVNDAVAALSGFTRVHPLQGFENAEGCVEVLDGLSDKLCEITGMDAITLQPAAGAHGEFTGMMLVKKYHEHSSREADQMDSRSTFRHPCAERCGDGEVTHPRTDGIVR